MLTLKEVQPLLTAEMREELADYDPVAAIAEQIDPKMLRGRHPLDKAQYTWIKTMLEGQILNWGGDRVDMANSMESRPAFFDHHLAELATTIPPELRIRNGVEKWVLREAMKGVLPKTLYERREVRLHGAAQPYQPGEPARGGASPAFTPEPGVRYPG